MGPALVGVLASALALAGWQQPAGVIEVTVRDASTGRPVPGADVTLVRRQTPPPNVVTNALADAAGRFVFRGLEPGNYTVNARHDAYVQPNVVTGSVARTLGPGALEHAVDITLTRGAVVSGRVIDSDGVPLAGASVQPHRSQGRAMLLRGAFSGNSVTDDLGRFRFAGVPPGAYYLKIELRPTEGAPEPQMPRTSYFPGVARLDAATPVVVRGGEEVPGLRVVVPTVRTYSVSGTVLNPLPGGRLQPNGQPIRSVATFSIGPRDLDSPEEPYLVPSQPAGGNPTTPVEGETPFRIPGLVPGAYYLYPIFDTGQLGAFTTTRTPIDIVDRDIEGLVITLQPGSEVRGDVVAEGAGPGGGPGVSLGSLRVQLRPRHALAPLVLGPLSEGRVDPATGAFALAGVPEGRFSVVVSGLPEAAYVSAVRLGVRNLDDGVLEVTYPLDEPLCITVRGDGARVEGTARDVRQAATPGAGVVLVPSPPRRANAQLYKRTTADPQGRFAFRGIAPGTYKVFAWPELPEGQAEEDAAFLAPFEDRGQTVTVGAGGAASVEAGVIGP